MPMMLHPDEEVAIDRGIDGGHFFDYSLIHHYAFGQHRPGITNIWQPPWRRHCPRASRHVGLPRSTPSAQRHRSRGKERRMRDLKGKVAVVTGAASGIGNGVATHLAEEGLRVVLADIEEAPLADAEK